MKLGIIFFCYFVFISSLYSQNEISQKPLEFRYLTIDQGLSNNKTRGFTHDSLGNIWIGTLNGLNKYNGYEVIQYMHNPSDKNTIPSNDISLVFTDSKFNIWVGTSKGLSIYNRKKDNFSKFVPPGTNHEISLADAMTEDKFGNVWIGTGDGLCSYNLNTHEFQLYTPEKYIGQKPNNSRLSKVLIDKQNKVWCSFFNCGISIFDPGTGIFRNFMNEPGNPGSISGNKVERIYQDSKGNIWIGTYNNGLNLFNPIDSTFKRYIIDPTNSFSMRVRAMFEDQNNNLYIGTRAGIYLFNETNKTFSHLAHTYHPHSILSMNSIFCSYKDKQGGLWLGTFSGGVNYANFYSKPFLNYQAKKNDPYFLNNGNVYAILEDNNGNLYVGTEGGMNFLNRETGEFIYYEHHPDNPNSLSHIDVKCFELDNNNTIWIGTYKGGLLQFNPETGKFVNKFTHDPENQNTISSNDIFDLFKDKNGNIWIISSDNPDIANNDIDIYNPVYRQFKHLSQKACFGFFGNDDYILIGASKGFWKYTYANDSFKLFKNDSLIGYTYTIIEDSKKNIWIGSDKGLVCYNPDKNSYKRYSVKNDYPFYVIYGILEDSQQNLWISSNAGLIKFNDAVNNHSSKLFTIFDQQDGLQSKQFNYGASYKSTTGELFFGGIAGFNSFFPEQIKNNPFSPEVELTKLRINNKLIGIDQEINGRVVLNEAFSETETITLLPKDIIITIEFAAIHFAQPEKNQYAYIMEGFDKEWNYVGNKKEATYTNMDAGEYVFRVKASNNDGVWNQEGASIKIIVIPPFWKTWWFRIITGLLLIGLILATYFYRIRSIRRTNIVLENTVKERTVEIFGKNEEITDQNKELEQHRNNLEVLVNNRTKELEKALAKAKESDELKSAFLANMSHEIRTPMNAISGFSELINEEDLTSAERAKYIEIIQSNAASLVRIIDEIIDLSLLESNQIKLINETFNLNALIDHLYSYYNLSNKNPKIKIRKNNTLKSQNLKLNSDSTMIKQIITNLMDNACKFTEKGFVELGANAENNRLNIYVEDTGRGIHSKEIDLIFQQFTKVEENDFKWTRGLGLGLAISQKIGDVLGAEILVKSTKGKGSIFTFSIPMDIVISEKEIKNQELEQPIPHNWEGKTILIAEDVEENYLYLEKALQKTRINIIWAKTGEEALNHAIENSNVDLILMDIKMPRLNGYEAAKKIKEHNPNQIIVAQTAYSRPEERAKYYDENFDEYLSKPINPVDMLLILEKFL